MDTREAFSHLLNKLFKADDPRLLIRLGYAKSTITSYRSRVNNNKPIREGTMKRMLKKAGAIYIPETWVFPNDIFD